MLPEMYLVHTEMTDTKLLRLMRRIVCNYMWNVWATPVSLEIYNTVRCDEDEGLTGQCLFFFFSCFWEESNWEDHQRTAPSLSWSPVAMVISLCLNVVLCVLMAKVQLAAGRRGSEEENFSKTLLKFRLFKFAVARSLSLLSAQLLVSSLGLCNAFYWPIHTINNWEHFMQTVSFGALSSLVTDPWH